MLKKSNGYRAIVRALGGMTEDELKKAIAEELADERRVAVLERLHQRFTTVRARRERAELLKELDT
jgi:hypothetical protein